ncbi:MAG TPA: agmatinase [Myxococcota bacterium]
MQKLEPHDVGAGSVAVLGIPWDEKSSFLRGAAEAPTRIRQVLHNGSSNMAPESGVDLSLDARLCDVGDLQVEGEGAVDAIDGAIAALAQRGARPLVLGGDHAVTYPIVRSLARIHPPLTLLHLDAHPDLYDEFAGDRLSHACPFARIMEEGAARRLVQLGIRTLNPHQRAQAERFGVEVIAMRDWEDGVRPSLAAPLYLSIDLDAFDPAYAPGVSHHEPGGLTVREVVRLIQDLPVAPIGADIVELNPRRDTHDRTAMLAVKLLKEIAGRMLAAPDAG